MKRFFILASAAIVALASCAKTEVVYKDAPAEIGFKAVTGAMTKADLGTTVHLGVFAEWVNPSTTAVSSYFDNADFSHNGGVWKGGQYWPKDGSLNFTFYAPHMETGVDYNDGTKTLSLTIPDNSSAQIDYLVGSTRAMEQTSAGGEVAVLLQHALASVKVTAVADKDIYQLTSVTLNNTKQIGKLDFVYADNGTSYEASVNGEATGDKDFVLVDAATDVAVGTPAAVGNENGYLVFPSAATTLSIAYTINGAAQTKDVTLDETWVSGKQYTYAISFTSNEILITPTVVDSWTVGDVTTNTTIQ